MRPIIDTLSWNPIVPGTKGLAALTRVLTPLLLFCLTLSTSAPRANEGLKLPNLGEASTSLFSAEYEHSLGRAWLSVFRSRAPTVDDPLLFDYLENLIYELVTHSQLEDRRIELVVVDNATINAFAVPGGVIGVHNGLLLWAQTEDEIATVLAHEIAHLSQRHFSRGVEFQRTQQPLTLAAMLASFAPPGFTLTLAAHAQHTVCQTHRQVLGSYGGQNQEHHLVAAVGNGDLWVTHRPGHPNERIEPGAYLIW